MLCITYGIDDGYALWGAAQMVIDYMEKHDGSWPRSWNDLQPQFNATNGNVTGWTFSQFQDRIGIDFGADPDELRRNCTESRHPAFRVIWARWDLGVRVVGDPNQMLCDYFRQEDEPYGVDRDVGGVKKEPPK